MKTIGVDLFCGGGGTTTGAHASGDVTVKLAVNHWGKAIETHAANHPETVHMNCRIEDVQPSDIPRKIGILYASPECTHHSRARGGKPTSDQQRSGAWELLRWINLRRPNRIIVENVSEFLQWGPVSDKGRPLESMKGHTFQAWVKAIESYGYEVDWRLLNAADFGAATSRERLFVNCRLGKGRTIDWPEPSHTRSPGGELPGMSLPRWRAASEIIDWSIPCPSIFGRSRPLADKTIERITAGLRRFVAPFVVTMRGRSMVHPTDRPLGTFTAGGGHHGVAIPLTVTLRQHGAAQPTDTPVGAITAGGNHHGVAVPFLTPNFGEAPGQQPRSHDMASPVPAVTGHGAGCLAVPFVCGCGARDGDSPPHAIDRQLNTIVTKDAKCLAVPFLAEVNHGHSGGDRINSIGDSIGTLTAKNGRGVAVPLVMSNLSSGAARDSGQPTPTLTASGGTHLILPWLTSYYGHEQSADVRSPVATVTTKDRHALLTAELAQWETEGGAVSHDPDVSPEMAQLLAVMRELGVVDIGFRMLGNRELSNAQGFPASYIYCGTKADVTRQIGNSVSPPVAEALTKSILGV